MPDKPTPPAAVPASQPPVAAQPPAAQAATDQSPIVQKLTAVSEGLLMPSENDYPFKPFFLEAKDKDAKLNPDSLPEQLHLENKTPMEERTLDDFLENASSEEDWMNDDEKAMTKKFKALLDALKAELKAPTVYLFGERAFESVIIGRVEGGFAGLVTTIVET